MIKKNELNTKKQSDLATNEQKKRQKSPEANKKITKTLIDHVGSIADACDASAVFVYKDAIENNRLSGVETLKKRIFYVVKGSEQENTFEHENHQYLKVPDVPLTRLGQVKIAIFNALSRGFIKKGDKIVFLAGISSSGSIDTILVTEVGKEFEIVATSEVKTTPEDTSPEVIEKVIEIATDLGREGREGKLIGTIFVLGDTENVLPLTKQLILNPFRGYEKHERNILDPDLKETVKELATIDGAFIIRGDGLIESCGTYLKTLSQGDYELPRGLGARHHAAAGITSVTNSIAVTVSQSTGTVSIFRNGRIITEIEKPRSLQTKA